MLDLNKYLGEIVDEYRDFTKEGNVATYIPQLALNNPMDLGICIKDGSDIHCAGDYNKNFTIQSVSKPLVLMLALMDNGEAVVFDKVGKEPTGDPFNSIIRLETYKKQKPYNPMINAGAISIASLVKGKDADEKINRILSFIRKLANNDDINIDQSVYKSEKETGNRNRSIAYFLRDIGNLENEAEEVLEVYFSQCSISITCVDLANIASVIAFDGKSPITGEQIVKPEYTRIAKSYMLTCGMYDGSGEFAINVGIPAKSGVGGGIMAVAPGRKGIAVYGPSLNEKGNSLAGIKLLERLSKDLKLNIFASRI
jgi:glutaminase